MARYGGPMASSRTALSQLVSPDRRLAWSLTAAARRREWERARVLRSWLAAASVGGAAATDGVGPATQRLREATDSLAGLAHGLRTVAGLGTVAAAETTAGHRLGN